MISDIATLTWWASLWDNVSVVAALAVFLGVAGESVSDFDTLAKWTRLESRLALRDAIAKAGLLTLIAALAVEVVAAIGSHNTNAEIIATLNSELDRTVQHDIALTNLTTKLGLSNNALTRKAANQDRLLSQSAEELRFLASHSADFERAFRSQRDRDAHVIAGLRADEIKLATARASAVASAGQAATAASVANKAQSDMLTALNDVKAMRERLQAIITPRQIDEAQFAALVAALKPFPKTPVDFAVTRQPECADLLMRIVDATKAADWAPQDWSGGILLKMESRPDFPQFGEVTGRDIQIKISETDRAKFEKPVLALWATLMKAGIQSTAVAILDKTPDGKPDPQAVPPGAIHVIVGAKSDH